MSAGYQSWSVPIAPASPAIEAQPDAGEWFAVQTRARHEKVIAQRLRDKGVTTFLPLVREVHGWSDRRKTVELPLFSCYVFARVLPSNEDRLRVLVVDGVLKFVGPGGQGIPIPEEQIEAVRRLVEEQLPFCSHPFLKIGQRVRIRSGALDGVEGILVARSGEKTLVVSIDAVQRSLAVRIEGYDVEPV
jgi:transcription termination/antitermination protein NusG